MNNSSSRRGLLAQILAALLCVALGVGIGIANPALVVFAGFAGATGILMALFLGRHRIVYLYPVFYGVAYGACRFYLEY